MPRAAHRTSVLFLLSLPFASGCGPHLPPRTASEGGSRWFEVTTPHLVLKTDLPEDSARTFAQQCETAYREVEAIVTPHAEPTRQRLDVVVFQDEDEFHAFGWERVAGFYSDRRPIELERHPTIVLYAARYGALLDKNKEALLHELTHRVVHHSYGGVPVWVDEGLAQFFSTLRIEGGEVILGDPPEWTIFTNAVVPPVRTILAGDRKWFYGLKLPDDYRRTERERNNYAAGWALTHFFMNGPDPYRARFQRFFSFMNHGVRPNEAWARALGDVTAEQLEQDFRAYLAAERWDVFKRPLTRPNAEPVESVKVIADADVHLLWLRTVTAEADTPAAVAQLVAARREAPGSAELTYWSGCNALAAGRLADARAAFEDALRARADDPRALLGLAVTLDRLAAKAPKGELGDLVGAQANALDRLAASATSADEMAAVAHYFAAERRFPEALARVDAAVALDPGSYLAHEARADVLASAGRFAEAAEAAERALRLAPESVPDSQLEAMLRRYRALAGATVAEGAERNGR